MISSIISETDQVISPTGSVFKMKNDKSSIAIRSPLDSQRGDDLLGDWQTGSVIVDPNLNSQKEANLKLMQK